ncbi:MAG: PSD1 and planctomycete cytochrome C domain-containing protein [Planctomycetota bacterium]
MRNRLSVFVWSLVCLAALCPFAEAAEPDGVRFFREKIEPVLKAQCYGCHSGQADKVQGGLRLDSRAGVLRGGEGGPAVVAGKSGASLLIQAIRHEGGLAMPPQKAKLPERTIADFVKWVEMGAPDPRESDASDDVMAGLSEGRKHWAFQPVRKVAAPKVRDVAWGRSAVDAFVLAKLEERQWQPAPPASRTELIRRVSFDLIGLPPSPDEIDAFVNDPMPDAYLRLVDRLLSSRHYGERWAQHWLDVVRYAETEGYEYDRHVPDAWRYRDYVIGSLNADKPFDRFLIEQIAGDEIEPDSPECQTASIFHRLGPVRRNAGNPDIALSRNEVLTERTDIIGATFLGLTVGCARCHNHKLEPISQKDYYRLQAYLAATEEHNIILASADEQRDWEAKTKRAKDEIDVLRARAKKAEGAEKNRLDELIETLEDQLPPPLATIPSTRNNIEKRTAIHVLRRGVWENKGEPVGARPPSVLVEDDFPELSAGEASPRTFLAVWLNSPGQPLTPRVIVNRLWQQHFGVGLVKTANDFGVKGERPSHPELLDWLAATLVESGWRLKPIHRLIVLSNTYQQSSHSPFSAQREETDPENRLQWHFPRRRLSAEEVRDAMLSVSGRINLKAGGPSVIVPVDPELVQLLYKPSQWSVTKDATEHDRRSVYLMAKRNLRLPFLENLDAPALQTSCARRESSTHAPQALEMLNGSLSNDLAAAFARRLEKEANGDPDRIVDRAFRLALGRPPLPDERKRSLDFLREQPLTEFALALFNLNGFLYVP